MSQMLGAGPGRLWCCNDSLRGSRNFGYFLSGISDFPSEIFYDISTQQRRSVSPCELSEENFKYLTIRGRFSKINAKIAKKIQALRLQAVISPQ